MRNSLRVDSDVTLVPRRAGDARELFAILERHRDTLREWLTWVDATRTLPEIRRYGEFAETQFETHAAFDYAIRSGEALVGTIGIHGLDWSSRRGEIGYWLSPDARGRGIMTRAARTIMSHAFAHLGLHRIEINCVVENLASRAVPERLGLPLEGILAEAYLLHGNFRDIALYATTATRWHP